MIPGTMFQGLSEPGDSLANLALPGWQCWSGNKETMRVAIVVMTTMPTYSIWFLRRTLLMISLQINNVFPTYLPCPHPWRNQLSAMGCSDAVVPHEPRSMEVHQTWCLQPWNHLYYKGGYDWNQQQDINGQGSQRSLGGACWEGIRKYPPMPSPYYQLSI